MVPNFLLALVLVFGAVLGPAAAPIAARASQPQAAAQAATYSLSLSKSANRSTATALEAQTVLGNIYIFVTPDTGAGQVRLYIDDTAAAGAPFRMENNPPYDLAGGSFAEADAYDTTRLQNGLHTVTASIDLVGGGTAKVTSAFTVSNDEPLDSAAEAVKHAQPTPMAQTTYANLVSRSADRSNATGLQGQTVSGNIYVFVSPESGVTQARFFLDNPSGTGTPIQTENSAPWDLAGGNGSANPYDTKKLSNGAHSITASLTLTSGAVVVSTANFTVNNTTATNTPAPTATAQPTATATKPPTATPTPQPTAIPTKLPTATAQPAYNNLVSKSSNRSSASALNAQTVSGNIYVFASPESGATQVNFYIDNTAASGTPYHTENSAPWDFAGGSSTVATVFDTRSLSNGAHSITAAITLSSGAKSLTTASFTVNNAIATNTPPPAPTATPGSSSGSIYWGVNMSGIPYDMAKLSAWERDVTGKAVSIVHWGNFWGDSSGNYRNWSNTAVNNARGHGSIPMISWTPEGGDPGKWQLIDIINGTHDGYIRQFATDAKTWGFPFFLRIMHEMNGSWGYPWQETQNGNQRGQFVQAWRHIVDIFRQVGVSNASYVWCPNIDYPNTTNPSFASLYPGDSYVDWTCLDGYNWGTNRSSGWQTFDQVYNYSYNEILKFAPSKPMMIGEFGSVEQGGSKANWFTDALSTQIPSRYPKVRAALYFNWQFDGVDWRIETSTSATDGWKRGIASSYYRANTLGSITGKVAVP